MEVKDGDDTDNAAEDKVVELMAKSIERVIDRKFSFLEKLSRQIDKLSIVEPSSNESEKKDDRSKEKKNADTVEGVDTVAKPEVKEMKEDKKNKETPPQKTVALSYKINCVSDVSVVASTFEIDVKIFTYWTDEKLVGRKNGSFIDYEKEKGLFEPDIIVTNEFQLNVVDKDSNSKIIDPKTGEVKRRKYHWHLTNVYLPTAAFLLISWLVFFYSVDSRAERIDICIATLLASISNK
ncbi:unnamed protein product [Sphagnum jensenii]|uniref:Uncharacterized protein n=1 Tax=Sphagnum jensenii TaxID=128206 RepID=A0ABP0VAC4_9BRYO